MMEKHFWRDLLNIRKLISQIGNRSDLQHMLSLLIKILSKLYHFLYSTLLYRKKQRLLQIFLVSKL